MRVKRAGIGTKLLVLVLLVAGVIALLSMRGQLMAAQEQRDELAQQVQAQQEENAALTDDIQHSSDPNYLADIARAMLGLVEPDEIRFVDTSDYSIAGEDALCGFIKGVIAGGYDNEYVFVDGIARIAGKAIKDMAQFFYMMEKVAEMRDLKLYITCSCAEEELPDFAKKYL